MQLIKKGLVVLREQTKLWLIAFLVVLLPLTFIISFERLTSAAAANIATLQKSRIAAFHDVLQLLPKEDIETILTRHSDIRRLTILEEVGLDLIIVYDTNIDRIETIETNREPFMSSLIRPGETILYEQSRNNLEFWQAFRAISGDARNPTRFIFTEHDFNQLESVLESRLYNAYISLSFIFLFLILLAYWISRQINYELVSKKLRAEIKERDVFMQSMVHELRAPLTAMRGYASLITESNQVLPEEKKYADRILTSTTRLVNLVNDFLEVAKIQASGLTFKKTSIDIVPVIKRSITDLEGFAKEKQLDLTSNISKTELFIFTDEKRLEQILTNLLSNALKYTKTGCVSVSLIEEVKVVKITVADTGVGMDVDGQKKLFTPFMRVGSAEQNANITGTGLGMWITKKLVEQLSGTIGIESISGVGTHVIVTLPKN